MPVPLPSGYSEQMPRVCRVVARRGHGCPNNHHLLRHVLCRARGRPYSIPAPAQTRGVGTAAVVFGTRVAGGPDWRSRFSPGSTGSPRTQLSLMAEPRGRLLGTERHSSCSLLDPPASDRVTLGRSLSSLGLAALVGREMSDFSPSLSAKAAALSLG